MPNSSVMSGPHSHQLSTRAPLFALGPSPTVDTGRDQNANKLGVSPTYILTRNPIEPTLKERNPRVTFLLSTECIL